MPKLLRLVGLLPLLLLTGCLNPVSPTPVPTPVISELTPTPGGTPLAALTGRIALVRAPVGQTAGALWLLRPDGTGATAYPLATAVDSAPVWSPDGTRLAYQQSVNGKDQLYAVAVKPDNTPGQTVLLTAAAQDKDNTFPSWSPDDAQIVYQSGSGTDFQLYVMNASGAGHPQQVPNLTPYAGQPAWSPDGKTIAFSGGASAAQGREVYTTAPAGGPALRLTNNEHPTYLPRWAPDGSLLAYLTIRAGGQSNDIYAIAPDGTRPHALADNPNEDNWPVWSPDSQWLAFYSSRGTSKGDCSDPGQRAFCNNDVFVVAAGGGVATNISNDPAGDTYPAWGPDSDHLIFSSNRAGGRYRLYLARRDGSGLRALTPADGNYDENFPVWSR